MSCGVPPEIGTREIAAFGEPRQQDEIEWDKKSNQLEGGSRDEAMA